STALEQNWSALRGSRTSRGLQATENGRIYNVGARKILDSIDEAEAAVMDVTQNPRGTIFVAAPLGIGRRLLAPHVPAFKELYPQLDVLLRLSDRSTDVVSAGMDVSCHLCRLDDRTLTVRLIPDWPPVHC